MNFDECPCSGKTLGRLVQPAILSLLAREPHHGYLLVQRLGELVMFRCQRPDPTGVYRALRSMEKDRLVVSRLGLSEAGPAKRQFELTAEGRACLVRWITTLQDYAAAIKDILEVSTRQGAGAAGPAKCRRRRSSKARRRSGSR